MQAFNQASTWECISFFFWHNFLEFTEDVYEMASESDLWAEMV